MIKKDELYGLLSNVKPATKNNVRADCPFCGKKEHYFINILTGQWDCKKCSREGNIYMLLKHLNQTHLLEGSVVDISKKLDTLKTFSDYLEISDGELDLSLPDKKMPIGFKRLDFYKNKNSVEKQYNDYLKGRKFTAKDYELYNPGYTELKSRYENYVLIPVERDYSLKGFVGRYIIDKDDERYEEDKLRYENSPNTEFAKLLIGYDEIDFYTQNLILVEGLFDKIGVTTELDLHNVEDFKCNGTFGKKISKYQLQMIKRTKVKNLFFMYDGRDAINDMKKRAYEAQKVGFKVFICYLYPKDPADSNAAQILHSLQNAKTPNNFQLDKLNKRTLK